MFVLFLPFSELYNENQPHESNVTHTQTIHLNVSFICGLQEASSLGSLLLSFVATIPISGC